MKKIGNYLFAKNEMYNLSSTLGGSAPTTEHTACYRWGADNTKHYVCDHSVDTIHDK